MKLRALFGLLIAFLAIPQTASAQEFALGGRAGTWGFGGEAALGFSNSFVIRGGVGASIFDFTGDLEGVEYTLTPPSMTATLGIDLYPGGGSFRIMAGAMYRKGDFEMESGDISQGGPIEIGDSDYDESSCVSIVVAWRGRGLWVRASRRSA